MKSTDLDDLRDFIDQKIDNSARTLKTELKTELKAEFKVEFEAVRREIKQSAQDVMVFVGDALDSGNHSRDLQLRDHEQRITKLEKRAKLN